MKRTARQEGGNGVRPKKSLGQHFLTDEGVAHRIAHSLPPSVKNVLEIGPGMGMLTKYLMQQPYTLSLVEVDTDSIEYLVKNYPQLKKQIMQEDFLQLDLSRLGNPLAVIGNFPYHISSQILFRILDHKEQVDVMVGMFQKEVAVRIASGPGNRDYGIPSVLLQAWYDIEYLFTVDAALFNPPPKVQSGVIKLTRNKITHLGCDEKLFRQTVRQAFNQRRKTLHNSLKSLIPPPVLSQMPYSSLRPEALAWQQFVELANFIAAHR